MRLSMARSGSSASRVRWSTGASPRPPDKYRPWTRRQVRTADSWPTRRDQPVSVALSPAGDRLALVRRPADQRSWALSDDHPRGPAAQAGLRAGARARLVAGRRQAGVPGRRRPGAGDRPVGHASAPGGGAPDAGSRAGERDGLHPGRRPAGGAGSVIARPDDADGDRAEPGGDLGAGPDQEADVQLPPGRGQPGAVARRAPARLHHGDVGGLGVRYRHRAAGAAIRRSLPDRHRPRLDRRRTAPLGLHWTRRCGYGARTTRCRPPSWRPSRRQGWSSCASGAPR